MSYPYSVKPSGTYFTITLVNRESRHFALCLKCISSTYVCVNCSDVPGQGSCGVLKRYYI